MAKQPESPKPRQDDLTKTGKTDKKKDIELKEDELERVTGGAFDTYMQFKDYKGQS